MRPSSAQCSQWEGASLATGDRGSVSVPNTAPHRARWPAHFLHMRYTNSPYHSFIPWSEDSRQAVDLLLWATIINYINLLTSSQTGIKWQHHDFFFLFSVCFVNITELFYFISSWAKVHSFLCPCFFFCLQTQKGNCAMLLGRIWSNLQEFPPWLPPQPWNLFLPHAVASQLCLPGRQQQWWLLPPSLLLL